MCSVYSNIFWNSIIRSVMKKVKCLIFFHEWIIFWWVLLNRARTSTQLHPPPLSSFQPPPSSFQPPPSSLQYPQEYLNQNIARNWAISPNLVQKIKSCSFWLKNWQTWYIGVADSESRTRSLKFRPQNPFLGQFVPKNSKLFVLSENWCT